MSRTTSEEEVLDASIDYEAAQLADEAALIDPWYGSGRELIRLPLPWPEYDLPF